jgi:hypothetical protein
MKPLPLLKLEMQRGQDCALACIASLTGAKYEDVLYEASRDRTIGAYPHECGLFYKDIIRVAKRLGCSLRNKRKCNFSTDEGILGVDWLGKKISHHVVVVMAGLIFDLADMTVWSPEEYKKANRAKFGSMLVPK